MQSPLRKNVTPWATWAGIIKFARNSESDLLLRRDR